MFRRGDAEVSGELFSEKLDSTVDRYIVCIIHDARLPISMTIIDYDKNKGNP